jgi:Type IV secretory system Conjugative DNA transfer
MIRVDGFDEKDDAEALARLMVIPDTKESHWTVKRRACSRASSCTWCGLSRPCARWRNCEHFRRFRQNHSKSFCLLLLDEAAALGSLEPLERGVGYLRAYCAPLLVFQDMSQLGELYRRAASFLANATCKVFFNVADLEAARFVFEIIGQSTSLARNSRHLALQHGHDARATVDGTIRDRAVAAVPIRGAAAAGPIVIFRSDILRYPVLASNYRSWRHWQWWRRYDAWPAS